METKVVSTTTNEAETQAISTPTNYGSSGSIYDNSKQYVEDLDKNYPPHPTYPSSTPSKW